MKDFGSNLAQLRKDRNYTQQQLADKVNVTKQAVSRWEQGVTNPDFDMVLKLANIFGVSVDYLLKGEEAPTGTAATTTSNGTEKPVEITLPPIRNRAVINIDNCKEDFYFIRIATEIGKDSFDAQVFYMDKEAEMKSAKKRAFIRAGIIGAILLIIFWASAFIGLAEKTGEAGEGAAFVFMFILPFFAFGGVFAYTIDVAFRFGKRSWFLVAIDILAFVLKTIIGPLAFVLKLLRINKEIKKTALDLERIKEQNQALV